MAVSENPPPLTTSTRKRLRPPPLADPDAEPNHNSKQQHLLSSSPIPSPSPNPNFMNSPSCPSPNPNPMNSPSNPNPNPNPNSMDSPSSPNANPNSMDSPPSPNPNPNPDPCPVPSHLPNSLAELESSLQATTPLENFSPCGDDDTLPDDLVIAEMMQSLERVITNKPEAVVAPVTPNIETLQFHPSEGITHTARFEPNSSSSGSGKPLSVKDDDDDEELIDGEIPCSVDASDCADGHMLDDLRHIIEASDDELGIIPAVVAKDSCSTEEELYEEVDLVEGGGVLDAAELEKWDVHLTEEDGTGACSSSSPSSSCSGAMDEEAVDYVLCDDAQIGVWDFEPDGMMNGMGEYVVDGYGGAGFEGLLMMIREPNASAG